MESLVATLMDSLLHPTVLVATAAACVLLFSGAIGWTLEFCERHHPPSRRPLARADVAPAGTRSARSANVLPPARRQPTQPPACNRTATTRSLLEPHRMRRKGVPRRHSLGPHVPGRERLRHAGRACHRPGCEVVGAMIATPSTVDPIGRNVAMPRGAAVAG